MRAPAVAPEVRFWRFVERGADDECWTWTGAKIAGYGVLWVNETRRATRAHRLAYEWLIGPIPEGLTLDHTCHNAAAARGECAGGNDCPHRACCNPAHLDPCGAGVNAARSPFAPYNVRAAWTHCKRGHEFTPENTRTHHGRRECRACDAERRRRRSEATCPSRVQHRRG